MTNIILRLRRRLRALLNPQAVDRELEKEMRAHIALEADEIARTGVAPDEAARRAAAAFGGVSRFAEDHRDARGIRWFTEFWSDVRYAGRSLRRAPGFTLSATLVLGLGIGASIAAFSAVDAVLIARLPYSDDHRLVRIVTQANPEDRFTLSAVDVQSIQKYSRTIGAIGAIRGGRVSVTSSGVAERLPVVRMNAGLLEALEVKPLAGRALTVADERQGAPATVVLAHAFAVRKFGSPSGAIDSVVTIDGTPHYVVGVLPPEHVNLGGFTADMYSIMPAVTPTRRGPFGIFSIARLRPGVTIDDARTELREITRRISMDWTGTVADTSRRLAPYYLRELIVGSSSRTMALFGGAVVLVLLVAVANVASLSIVRSLRRWREISLRAVLGASRTRLVRLMVTESLVLSAIAGAVGIALGWVGLKAFQAFSQNIPRLDTASIDGRAVLVAIALTLVVGVAIGIVPALRLIIADRGEKMRHGARTIGDTRHSTRMRAIFVGAEFALALPLLAIGGLLLNSLMRLNAVDPGFDPRGVIATRISVPSAAYTEPAAMAAFWKRVETNVLKIPGVTGVSFGTLIPPNTFGGGNNNFDLVDSPTPPGQSQPSSTWANVNPEFFETLRVPLREGRMFTASDTATGADTSGTANTRPAQPAVIVTEAWAKRYFPGRSAVGRELFSGGCTTCARTSIVGVVGDVTLDGLTQPGIAMFRPLSAGWPSQLNLFVRTSATVGAITPRIREAIRAADPSAAPDVPTTLDEQMHASTAQPRYWATILIGFAGAALVMAAVGVFGLLSYAVELRRREIGVRMALGAQASRVVQSMIAGGMRCAAIGAALGIALTLVASRWMRALLFEVSSVDPTTLLAATAGLLVVAMVACWVPARRAAAIDPTEAIRGE